MTEENYEIDELSQKKRKEIIKEIRKAIFEAENNNMKLKKPLKDSDMQEQIIKLLRRKAEEL